MMLAAEPSLCNIALNKPAYQSGERAATVGGGPYRAELALDGNTATSVTGGLCSVTGATALTANPWWIVDLNINVAIKFVLLTACKSTN